MGLIKKGDRVLFFGDSITDAGRDRENKNCLGFGYPSIAAALFKSIYPESGVEFLNRGISGDRARDLRKRLDEDCIDLRPDLLSVLIGINDTWRRYDSGDHTSCERFLEDYRYILTRAREAGMRLLIMEPFLLHAAEGQALWREDLDPKISAVRALAREFGAALLPLDKIFSQKAAKTGAAFWAEDGVHPGGAGAALIARCWLETAAGVKFNAERIEEKNV